VHAGTAACVYAHYAVHEQCATVYNIHEARVAVCGLISRRLCAASCMNYTVNSVLQLLRVHLYVVLVLNRIVTMWRTYVLNQTCHNRYAIHHMHDICYNIYAIVVPEAVVV
jgi:hypothetical protein